MIINFEKVKANDKNINLVYILGMNKLMLCTSVTKKCSEKLCGSHLLQICTK